MLSDSKSCIGKDYALQYAQHAGVTRMQQKHAALVGGGDASAGTMSSFVLRLSDTEKEMAEWISYLVEITNRLAWLTVQRCESLPDFNL